MSNCVNSNLSGKDQAIFNSLTEVVGEQKAFAMYQKDDMFNKLRTNISDTYPEIELKYAKKLSFKDKDVFNQMELSEMTKIADNFNTHLIGLQKYLDNKEKLKTLDKNSDEYTKLFEETILNNKYSDEVHFTLGTPLLILQKALGLDGNKPIVISKSELINHIINKHDGLELSDLKHLVRAINNPIAIFSDQPVYDRETKTTSIRTNSYDIITELKNKEGKLIKFVITINSNKYGDVFNLGFNYKGNDLTTGYPIEENLTLVKNHIRGNRTLFVNEKKMIPILNGLSMNDTTANKSEVDGTKRKRSRIKSRTNIEIIIDKVEAFENKSVDEILFQRQFGKIIGQANIKARTVLIDAMDQKLDTLPHEYAHHYIAWFRNTKLVQEGINLYGSEEALVQAIGEQVVTQNGKAYNWWKSFITWLLNKNNETVKNLLTNGFLDKIDLREYNSDEFFKTISNGNKSKLYEELSKSDTEIIPAFEVAYSDNFTKVHPWNEMQQIKDEKELDAFVKNNDINLDNYYPTTLEPKLEVVESHKDIISIAQEKFSKDLGFTKDTKTSKKVTDNIIKKYTTIFKKKFGVKINVISKVNLPKDAKGVKGFYSTQKGEIFLVKEEVSGDTIFHEMFHPILDVIKRKHAIIYHDLVSDLDNFKDKKWYKEVIAKYPELTPSELIDELIVTAVGLNSSELVKGKLGKTSAWKTFLDLIESFLKELNLELKQTFGVKGNVISLSKTSTKFTIDNISKVLIDESMVFEGIKKDIKENVLFYDNQGNPIKINSDLELDNFIASFSKDLENNDKDFSNPTIKDFKTLIKKMINDSNDYKIEKANEDKYKINDDYQSPTALLRELSPNKENSLDIAARVYLIQTKDDYEKLKKDPEELNKNIARLVSEYKNGDTGRLEPIINSMAKESKFFKQVGDEGHKLLESFFKRLDILKSRKDNISDLELETIKEEILKDRIVDNLEVREKYTNLLDGIITFVKDIEKTNKGKGVRYLPEFILSSDKIEKEGVIDLLVVTNDGKFSVFDFKFKKTEASDRKRSFDKGWNMGFEKYTGTNIWSTGKNKASLQISLYSLGLGLEYSELKEDKTGVVYIEVESQEDSENNLEVKSYSLKKAENGNSYHYVSDYRGVILDNVSEEKRKELYKDIDAVEGAINNSGDFMSYLLGDKEVDTKDFERLALNFYNEKEKWVSNPDIPGEKGFLDLNANKVIVGFALKPKFVRLDNLSKEDALKTLEDYYKVKDTSNEKVIDNALSYHQTGNFDFNKGVRDKEKAYIEKMLKGIDHDWELKKLTSIPGMENQKEPIVLAVNSKTGMSRILYFSKDRSENITFRQGSSIRKTITGNISEDKYLKTKFKNKELRNANKENFRLLKSTLIAAKLKNMNSNFNLDRVIISEGVGSGVDPTVHSITEGLAILNITKNAISEQVEFKGEIKKIFENTEVFNERNYNPNYIDNLLYIFEESSILPKAIKDKVFDVMENYRKGQASKQEALQVLIEVRGGIIETVNASNKYDKFEHSKEYLAYSHAILDIAGIQNKTLKKNQNWVVDNFVLERNSPEYMRRAMMTEINNNEVQLRREVNKFELILNKKLTALAKSKGISLKEAIATGSVNRLYTNMYQNIDNYDSPETIMTLKDADDKSNNLNKAEREFIRFFNEHIFNSTKQMSPNIFKSAEKEDDEHIITKGWVPIYPPRDQSKHVIGGSLREEEVRDASIKDKDYLSRVEMPDGLGSKFSSHQYFAGIDKQSKEKRPDFNFKDSVELNLEAILKSAVVESIESKIHDKTLIVYEALRSVVEGEYFLFGDEASYRNIITRLDEMRDQFIFNESAMKTSSQRGLAMVNKLATGVVIISGKQAIMDSMTFGFSSSSYMVANVIQKLFDGEASKQIGFFGFKSWAKSGKMMMSNHRLLKQIQAEFGLDESNSMYLKSANKLKSMRSDWMEIGFTPTRTTMKAVHMQIMIASMIEDGSFNAYSLDEDGVLQYDEKKDPRFYNEKGELINEEFLLAVKNQALQEGYSLEDYDPENPKELIERKLLYGYTFKERETIRSKSVDMIGVIGKEGEAKFSQIAVLRYFMKFKAWIIAKANLYMRGNQMSEVYSEWKRIENSDGTLSYELIDTEIEGIFQSMASIINKITVYKLKVLKNGSLTTIEKRNLAILASHLIHFAALVGMSSALYLTCSTDDKGEGGCWVDDTIIGKTSQSLLKNVRGDIMTPISIYEMIFDQGSLFAGIDAMKKLAIRIAQTPFNMVYNEEEEASAVLNDALVKSWAMYRDSYSLVELFKNDEPIEGFGADPFKLTEPISPELNEKLETGEGL